MAAEGASLNDALDQARRLGLAEPDASSDVSGRDAAEKLVVLLQHLGLSDARTSAFEIHGIEHVRTCDLAGARRLGGVIKPVVDAAIDVPFVRGFVGPAWLPAGNPLARLDGVQNGVRLIGAEGERFHAGPGAGPDVTAQTILDDVVEIAAGTTDGFSSLPRVVRCGGSPTTGWFVRFETESRRASYPAVVDSLARRGIRTRTFAGARPEGSRALFHALIEPCPRDALDRALAELRRQWSWNAAVFRALLD
jgi:homoserine dehydrogenase